MRDGRDAERSGGQRRASADTLELEELEARILLSTFTLQDPGAGVDVEEQQISADEVARISSALDAASPTTFDDADELDAASEQTAEAIRRELVFIDEGVEDYDQLVTGLMANADEGREFEVLLLSNARDGIDQISEALADYQDVDAIHIVSHGTEGAVQLGDAWLSGETLASYESQLAGWASSLSGEADLLFYGCNLAETAAGQSLINDISSLTLADVAASTDLTGDASQGGDWALEFSVGQVESKVAVSAELQQAYQGTFATYTVTSLADSGAGSLREAIALANTSGGADAIEFGVAGTINLSSALPNIGEELAIDGSTAPGYSGDPVVNLDGSGVSGNGLRFTSAADNSSVNALMITNFTGNGIQIDSGADGISITGNWIGTTGTGTTGDGNSNNGINVQGANTVIGGTGANDGNVITHNGNEGINLTGSGATGTLIQGNIIGLDPDGSTGSGNGDVGLALLAGSHNTTIGGTTEEARNIISMNYEGIEINSNDNKIQGNYIGTDISGTLDRGNDSDDGIEIQNNATGNLIGGTEEGAGNLIAFNALDGVNIVSGSGNAVLGNDIYSNGDQEIDLGAGANGSQSAPMLSSASVTASEVSVNGSLSAAVNDHFRIEFFAESGGVQTYLGFVNVATDGSGNATINTTLNASVAVGATISATATDSDAGYATFGNSSELSSGVVAADGNDAPVITSDGGASIANVDVAENTTAVTTVTATDADLDTPTFSITGGTDETLFEIDTDSGLLSFKVAPNFEGNANDVYEVEVTADDGNTGTDVQTITVNVTNVAPIANSDGTWFDETDGGAGFGSFAELADAHAAYLGATEQTIDFETLSAAEVLSNQYSLSHGVTFSNAGTNQSGIHTEGGAWIENVTGYDGSYAADGSNVYLKMANDVTATPFTIEFDSPVAEVGALLGMGKEGTDHSLTVSLYDTAGDLIDQKVFESELWDQASADQNFETFFAAKFDSAIISKIEVLNSSNVDYANVLLFDQLTWSHTPSAADAFVASTAIPLTTGDVLANDADPAGGAISISGFTQAANGTVAYNGDGTFTYTSDAGFTGTDTFDYTISDGDGGFDTATVSILVTNDAPVARNDPGHFASLFQSESPINYWRLGETSGSIASDAGSAGLDGTYVGVTLGETGAILGDSDGAARFDGSGYLEIPHSDDLLLDEGTLQLWFNADSSTGGDLQHLFSKDSQGNDTGGHLSMYLNLSGQLEVRLQSVSASYVVTSSTTVSSGDWHHAAVSFGSNGLELYLDGALVDTDAYTGGLGTSSGGPGNHEPTVIGGGTQLSGNLVANPINQLFTGLIDEVGLVGEQLDASTIQNLYEAGQQNYTLAEDGSLVVPASEGVLINDTDVEGHSLTAVLVSGPSNAQSFTLNPDGSFNYTPIANFNGTDSFTYRANDGTDDSNLATVILTVTGEDDAAVITGDTGFSGNEGDVVAGDLDATDVEGLTDTTYFTVTTPATNGTAVIDTETGAWSFTPTDPNWSGTDSFEVTVTDDLGGTTTQLVSITLASVNDAPVMTAWFDDAWDTRKGLTIDAANVAGDVTGFPVLITLNVDAELAAQALANGDDILFTAADGTTQLAHEIEFFDETTGELRVWVKTDLSASVDTDIFMYFGNSGATNQENIAAVWANYVGVYHLGESPTGAPGELIDSSGSGNHATTEGSMDGADSVATAIGQGLAFDGSDDLLRIPDSASLDSINDAATFSLWINFVESADGDHQLIMSSSNRYGGGDGYEWANQGDGDHFFYPDAMTPDVNYNLGANPFTDNTWQHLAATMDFATQEVIVYVDGSPMTFSYEGVPGNWTSLTSSDDLLWGGNPERTSRYFLGMMDEIRIADVVRSQEWIQTEVNNQSAPSSFFSMGATEARQNTLTDINEDDFTPAGDTVLAIINSSGADRISDVDVGAVEGIAVSGVDDTNGEWQYDANADGTWLAFGSVTDSDAVLLDGSALVRFVPDADYNGTAGDLIFHAWDQTFGTNGNTGIDVSTNGGDTAYSTETFTATLNVMPVADAAVITGDISFSGNEGDVVAGDLDATDADGLTDTTYFTVSSAASNGTAVIDAETGAWSFTPTDSNWFGSDSFEVTVTDDLGGTTTQLVNITLANVDDAAIITGDVSFSGNEGDVVAGDLDATDVEGLTDSTYFTVSSAATNGTAVIDAETGAWSFTPTDPNWFGTDSFEVIVTDDLGGTTTQIVNITLANVNDSAVITGTDTAALTEDSGMVGGYLNASGSLTATDVDPGESGFTAATLEGSLGAVTIDAGGNWNYTVDNSLPAIQGLASGATVNDVIAVASLDGTTKNITITISGNAVPAAVDDTYSVSEDGTLDADWWDASWTQRQTLTLDNSAQSETLVDFPVLVVLNTGNIDYAQTNDDGSDLRFFDADGDALDFDIEQWDESGDSHVWVKVPQVIGGSSSGSITMYYGNSGAASAENASAVWSDGFEAVHHLGDDLADATVDNHDATSTGTTTTDGQIGDGQLFDGSDGFVNLGNEPSVNDIFNGGGTVSAWINPTSWGEGGYGRVFSKAGSTLPTGAGWSLELYGGNQSLLFQRGFSGGSGLGQWYTPTGSLSLDEFSQVTLVYDDSSPANDPEIYINGVLQALVGTGTHSGTAGSDAAFELKVGNYSQSDIRTFDGVIDNVQIASEARSADWVKAQYLSTNDGFVTFGGPETVGAFGGVLSNDTGADPHTPSATNLDTTGTIGLVVLNEDGTFTYDTNGQFDSLGAGDSTTDSFAYTLDDGVNPPTVATVTITVNGSEDAAMIGGDIAYVGDEGDSVGGTMTATDAEGLTDTTYFTVSSGATNGTALIDAENGAWSFTPTDGNWFGTDSFEVTVTDDLGGTTTQLVSITLANVDDAAMITGDVSFSGDEGDAVAGDLNATDVEGLTDTTYFSVSSGATNGTALIDVETGAWSFTPTDPNWFGTDSFEVTVTDDLGGTTTQLVSITLANVDDAAVITGDVSFSGDEGDVVAGDLNATDVDGLTDTTYFSVSSGATNGTALIDVETGAWSFTPTDPNWYGSDSFEVTVTDDLGGTTTQLVSIMLANVDDAAVITGNTSFSGNEGDAVAGDLDATDVDGLTDTTYFTVSSGATNGTALIDAETGAWSFTPTDPNWFGSDSFEVTVTDDLGGTTTQLISITLANVDDASVITGNTSFTGNEGDAVAGDLDATDVDGLTDTTYFSISAGATNGTALIDADTGAWSFTPTDPDWFGTDSFEVTVTDDLGGTTTQLINITLANVDDAAIITGNTSFSGNEGDAVAGDLDATDVDGLTDTTYFSVTSPAANGTAVIDAETGAWSFTPTDPNWFGTDSFEVTVTDDLGGITTQLVSITLASQNDAPTAFDDSASVNEGASVLIDLAANDFDPDDGLDLTSIQIVSGPANGSLVLNGDGTVDYTHDGSETLSDSFTYSIKDPTGATSNTATVSLTITPQNDAPVLGNNSLTIAEGGVVVLTGVDLSATDAETAPGSLQLSVSNVVGGQFELVSGSGTPITTFSQAQLTAGDVQFVHDGTEAAPSYDVSVSDGLLVDGPLAATITFTNVNDAPTLDLDADDSVAVGTGFDSTFVMAAGPVSIVDADAAISDDDDAMLVGLNVTITNLMDSGVEILQADTTGTSISASYDAGTGVLTLSGTDSVASYEQVLRTISYDNTALPPDGTTRVIAFVADDGLDLSTPVEARVAISVSNVDPTATPDAATVAESGSIVLDLAANDVDPENAIDLTSIQIVSAPGNGSVVVGSGGTVTYAHDGSETTSDSFDYTIRDADGGVSNVGTVSLTIVPVNDAPTATGEAYAVDEDVALVADATTGVVSDEFDAEGDALTAVLVSGPSNATSFTLNADGSFAYVPASDFAGTDQFSYYVSDGTATTGVVGVSLTVLPVNDAPVLMSNAGTSVIAGVGDSITASELAAHDVDDVAADLYFTLTAQPTSGHLELTTNPGVAILAFTQADIDAARLVYMLDDDTVTSDSFSFDVSDASGASLGQTSFEVRVQSLTTIPPIELPAPEEGESESEPEPDGPPEEASAPSDDPEIEPDAGSEPPPVEESPPSLPPIDLLIETRTEIRFAGSQSDLSLDEAEDPVAIATAQAAAAQAAERMQDEVAIRPTLSVVELEREVERALDETSADRNAESAAPESDLQIWVERGEQAVMAAGLGIVAALLRGGSLMALTASSVPIWKGLDPVGALLVSDERRERRADEIAFAERIEDETDDVGRILDTEED